MAGSASFGCPPRSLHLCVRRTLDSCRSCGGRGRPAAPHPRPRGRRRRVCGLGFGVPPLPASPAFRAPDPDQDRASRSPRPRSLSDRVSFSFAASALAGRSLASPSGFKEQDEPGCFGRGVPPATGPLWAQGLSWLLGPRTPAALQFSSSALKSLGLSFLWGEGTVRAVEQGEDPARGPPRRQRPVGCRASQGPCVADPGHCPEAAAADHLPGGQGRPAGRGRGHPAGLAERCVSGEVGAGAREPEPWAGRCMGQRAAEAGVGVPTANVRVRAPRLLFSLKPERGPHESLPLWSEQLLTKLQGRERDLGGPPAETPYLSCA